MSAPPAQSATAPAQATWADVNRDVIRTIGMPSDKYFAWLCLVVLVLCAGFGAWTYQIWVGIGAAGKRTPVMWAMYITTFVFWIGIGHAGTLISAVLYLFRAKWRTSIYRGAEAMTVFAVMTAGLFPLIHAGRMWFAYWLMPYPNQRYLWPNFKSPLVWDVFAISTYLTISVVFFIVGLVPDIAALRDNATGYKRKIYAVLSLGWEGSDQQWRHYRRGYGLLAALATPLVLSVHSVVSFDFAMALVPGWHSTLFPPFFVDGAIFSGFAMVLVLILPMRYLFNWYPYITDKHLDAMAKLTLVTSLVLTYFYVCEVFTAWYSGDHFERASVFAKASKQYAWAYWGMYFCNCLVPLVLFIRRARTHVVTLYVVSIFVLIGMWLERFNIIVPGLAHDFYPYTWGTYYPTITDSAIVIGSFAWFFLLFLGFIRVMPSLSIVEVKEVLPHPLKHASHGGHHWMATTGMTTGTANVLGVFAHVDTTLQAIRDLRAKGFSNLTVYTPVPVEEIEHEIDKVEPLSKVRLFTVIGALHRDRDRLLPHDLDVAQVGAGDGRQGAGVHPALRHHRVRADHPARRPRHRARGPDPGPAPQAQAVAHLRPALHAWTASGSRWPAPPTRSTRSQSVLSAAGAEEVRR